MAARTTFARPAFSLVELVIVLLILGILSSVAVPRLIRSRDHYRVELAARRIIADLELARIEAENTSADIQVNFSTSLDSYTLVGVEDINSTAVNYKVSLFDEPYSVDLTTADFGGDASVVYNGFGKPDSDGIIDLASGSSTRRLNLDADSGRVRGP